MQPEHTPQPADLSRRQLLVRAGWAVPVILGVAVTRDAFAQYKKVEKVEKEAIKKIEDLEKKKEAEVGDP
jgi:hypothetical protein